jgi:hypothetical protein
MLCCLALVARPAVTLCLCGHGAADILVGDNYLLYRPGRQLFAASVSMLAGLTVAKQCSGLCGNAHMCLVQSIS